MHLSVSGKQMDVGGALKSHVEQGLATTVTKYFDNAIEAHVVFSRVAHQIRSDISVHVGRGIIVQGHGESADAYSAFDGASDRIGKRLRRYKGRLRDHHRNRGPQVDTQMAQQYVLAANHDEDDGEPTGDEASPMVIAESSTQIATVTVGEAVMMMDLAELAAMMFRNVAHGGLNMLYRRQDGNIGWVDPRGNREKTKNI
ncbi:MAG: ribosome-associated translation inhibitor RaiA [Alphaproteobacteria bacterium]|nr:ribosome-associated translation inhibitor RaiA [Alphaproteobacteria bacterium]